ncbi:MAG: hypothetical protein JWO26_2936 [Rhodospirillales bacterium]|nr:hypothetical protein [Rhodospirillales bacterium]
MTVLTDYARDLVARAVCARGPALPTNAYLALGTGGTLAAGITGEPVGAGYARQRVTFAGTGDQASAALLRFTFTAGVGSLTHIGMFDAVQGGNPLTFSVLATPAALPAAGQVTIPAANFLVTAN